MPKSVSRLIGSVSYGFEEVVAFLVGEQFADMTHGLPELVICPRRCLSDQRLIGLKGRP